MIDPTNPAWLRDPFSGLHSTQALLPSGAVDARIMPDANAGDGHYVIAVPVNAVAQVGDIVTTFLGLTITLDNASGPLSDGDELELLGHVV